MFPVLWIALGAPVAAQDAQALLGGEPAPEASAPSKLEEVRARIASVEARAEEWAVQASAFERAREEAAERLTSIRKEIVALKSAPAVSVDPDATTSELEVALIGAEPDAVLAQREVAELNAELERRAERRRQLPQLLADAKTRLAKQEAGAPAPSSASPELDAANARLAEALVSALQNETRAYEQELLSYQVRGELLVRRIERARLRAARAASRRDALQQALTERRAVEAERSAQQALDSLQEAAALSDDMRATVSRLATETAELARRRTGEDGLLEAIEDTTQKLQNAERRVAEVEADAERLVERVESSGLSDAVGLLLRKTRAETPDVGMYRRFIRMRQDRIAEVEARQEELREELESLSDIDALVEGAIDALDLEGSDSDRIRLESLLHDLLETKRDHLEELLGDYDTYFQRLVDFDARQQELVEKTDQLLRYIDERILWIPSGARLQPKLLRQAGAGFAWFTTPRYWGQIVPALRSVVVDTPISTFAVLLLFAAAIPLLRRAGTRHAELAEVARRPDHIHVRQTSQALLLAFFQAAWGAGLLAWLGWRLGVSPDATQFVRCFAHGMVGAALFWGSLALPRSILRADGPGEAHFGWPRDAVHRLHRDLGWLVAVALPLVFVIQVFEMRAEDDWRESIGRVCLIALLVAVTLFTHRALREGGPLRTILVTGQLRGLTRWQWRAVHLVALAPPIALGLAALNGYYWTAVQLGSSYHLTLVYLFAVLVALRFTMRWTLIARRRLALEKWEQERAKQLEESPEDASDERAAVTEPEIDLATVDAQTGRLLSTTTAIAVLLGLWFLWSDLVPAVGVLDRVELWTTTQTRSVELPAADGSVATESQEQVVPITLHDLFVALLIAFLALVLVRNLAGLLEITIFRRLGTKTGERYAYTTIAKYGIFLVGGVMAAGAIGIGWSNIQWLVAAVGIGLGFGLQEIFANFISGLIILFERPIRVGDTVTVGSVSGTVTKIRIRATWITGFDRKELVVPNKEFVTNQLVNWSLTDPILRVDVPVGIAYGSDTELAMRELLAVAEANPHVIAEPKPQVYFLAFGESSLDLELRCYSPDVDHRLRIVHELHVAIDRAFREAGIEIAFPQRDLHFRSGLPSPPADASADE